MKLLGAAASLLLLAQQAAGHARWACPKPRDEADEQGHHILFDNTGNKYGACGPFSGLEQYGRNGVTKLRPGPLTVTWEESVAHKGSPFRIAILDAEENVRMVLLDHVPHWDDAKAMPYVEKSYVKYHMTIDIPDVKCDKCILQLVYFMTDKSTKCGMELCTYYAEDSACSGQTDASQPTCFGAPNDVPCQRPFTCFSNYHTCTDISIAGARDIAEFELDQQPEGWPYKKLPASQYGAEAAEWEGGWLKGIPSNFTTVADFLGC